MAPKSKAPCYVLGVGMTKFIKPRGKVDYTELGFEAGVKAMVSTKSALRLNRWFADAIERF